eukprot:CAMPEP_0180298002 /NCGR_PEP_ID=MMETSP0988-20121125/20923_1 /TAXON_ID=697907 /ORGANISM="non described non described, Strain CCMP2293" /LENGTH=71 /DNA_ID=CAMNT_0022276865 /DNA_START=116 /DNA_END=331 /DNA_ORIENTATION=+
MSAAAPLAFCARIWCPSRTVLRRAGLQLGVAHGRDARPPVRERDRLVRATKKQEEGRRGRLRPVWGPEGED